MVLGEVKEIINWHWNSGTIWHWPVCADSMYWLRPYFAKFGDQLLNIFLERNDIDLPILTDLLVRQTKLEYFIMTECSSVTHVPPLIVKLFKMSTFKALEISSCFIWVTCQREILVFPCLSFLCQVMSEAY